MSRPEPAEYDPYYERYISLVPEEDVVNVLAHQSTELARMFHGVSDSVGTFAYEEGKWTAKEVLSHLIDGERMFAYRVFRIARGDQTPIEGFEQDGYIENSHANRRSISDLLDELNCCERQTSCSSEISSPTTGHASGQQTMSRSQFDLSHG